MAMGRREEDGYWRWDNRGGAMGGYQLLAMATAAVLGPYQSTGNQSYVNEVDPEKFQMSYSRPRLRWTQELHDQFVEAVNQLGGPYKATPKSISHIMRVEGVTLFHLKSHLQKYRLGKIARRLLKRDILPVDLSHRRDEGQPQVNLKAQGSPMSCNEHDVNGNKTFKVEKHGNLHLLVEKPQTAVKNMEMIKIPLNKEAGPSVKLEKEEVESSKPVLLPLFPACEWTKILDEVDKKPVASLTDNGPSMDDYLGCYSFEFALTGTHNSSRASMVYGSFFDEVASFSKVDYDDLTVDHGVPALEDDGFTNHYL